MRVEIKWNPHSGSFWHVAINNDGNGEIRISKKQVDELITKLKKIREKL